MVKKIGLSATQAAENLSKNMSSIFKNKAKEVIKDAVIEEVEQVVVDYTPIVGFAVVGIVTIIAMRHKPKPPPSINIGNISMYFL